MHLSKSSISVSWSPAEAITAQEQGGKFRKKEEECSIDIVSRVQKLLYYQNTTYSLQLPVVPTICFKKSCFRYVLNNVFSSGF